MRMRAAQTATTDGSGCHFFCAHILSFFCGRAWSGSAKLAAGIINCYCEIYANWSASARGGNKLCVCVCVRVEVPRANTHTHRLE